MEDTTFSYVLPIFYIYILASVFAEERLLPVLFATWSKLTAINDQHQESNYDNDYDGLVFVFARRLAIERLQSRSGVGMYSLLTSASTLTIYQENQRQNWERIVHD